MEQKDWEKYIQDRKRDYKKLGYIECPVFNNEKVYFNRYGLKHLMYKGRVPRQRDEVVKRFYLLPYVVAGLKSARNVISEEKRMKGNSHAYFWTLQHMVNNKTIRIILRRLGDNGSLHFFSIMSE